MRHSRYSFLMLAVMALAPLCVAAADNPNLDASAIRTQQAQIRAAAMAGTGIYKDLSASVKQDLFRNQDRVNVLLADARVTTDLPEAHQIELFNSLESIAAIVNNAEDERMICRRHKPIGSNRSQTICRTVAQIRADRDAVERDTGRRTNNCSDLAAASGSCSY